MLHSLQLHDCDKDQFSKKNKFQFKKVLQYMRDFVNTTNKVTNNIFIYYSTDSSFDKFLFTMVSTSLNTFNGNITKQFKN